MTERRWWQKFTLPASIILLALIVMSFLASMVFGGSSHLSRPSAVQHPQVDVTWGSRCGLPHGSQDPVVGPPAAKWALVGSVAAPSIPGVGPAVLEGHDRRCYQHSPLGALLAAANLLALGSLPPNAMPSYAAQIDHYVPGHLRDVYGHQPAIPVPAGTTVVISGFTVDAFDRDTVNVSIALRVNGTLGYETLPMRWTEPAGDWRAQLDNTQEPFNAGTLDSLADYIPWQA